MSTNYTVEIHCDACGNWMLGAAGPKASGLATQAVKLAKKNGWSRVTNAIYQDLYPNCLTQAQKGQLHAQ